MKGESLLICNVCSGTCEKTFIRIKGKSFCSDDCLLKEEGDEGNV